MNNTVTEKKKQQQQQKKIKYLPPLFSLRPQTLLKQEGHLFPL